MSNKNNTNNPRTISPELDAALEAGRARGRVRVAEILAQADMLSATQFGARIGCSRYEVAHKFRKGEIIGLKGTYGAYRYPAWQVDDQGNVLTGLKQALDLTEDNSWSAYSYLMEYFPDGSDDLIHEKLRKGETEIALSHLRGVIIYGNFT